MHRFMGLALPSPRVEEWKYTNLAELASKPFGILGEDKKIDELVCSNVDEIDSINRVSIIDRINLKYLSIKIF